LCGITDPQWINGLLDLLIHPFIQKSIHPDFFAAGNLIFRFSVALSHCHFWGRTGFDFENTPEAACRGWFVGLVKNQTKT
jgi:hypothetical protein